MTDRHLNSIIETSWRLALLRRVRRIRCFEQGVVEFEADLP